MSEYVTQKAEFQEQGYLLLSQFFSPAETDQWEEALRRAQPRFPTALDKGGLVFREFLHFHSPRLQTLIASAKMVDFLKDYIGNGIWLRKDQTVEKYPGGAEFPWHQDNGYNGLKDAYFQFWIALTDMTPENGGLSLIPGTHRQGIAPHAQLENHKAWQGDDQKAIAVRAKRGDVLFFSSLLLHRSGPNRTDKNRFAYVLEFMSSDHLDPFAKPPFFQIARNGCPDPKFVRFYRGNLSLANQLYYLGPRVRQKKWEATLAIRNFKQKLITKT